MQPEQKLSKFLTTATPPYETGSPCIRISRGDDTLTLSMFDHHQRMRKAVCKQRRLKNRLKCSQDRIVGEYCQAMGKGSDMCFGIYNSLYLFQFGLFNLLQSYESAQSFLKHQVKHHHTHKRHSQTYNLPRKPLYLDEYFEMQQNTAELDQFRNKCQALKDNTDHTSEDSTSQQNQQQPEPEQKYTPNHQEETTKNNTTSTNVDNTGKPYCGCGIYYSCTSALYLHIRTKHKGNAPKGTIGGPRFRGLTTNIKATAINPQLSKVAEVKIQQIQNIPKAGNPSYYIYKGMLPDSEDQNPTAKQQPEPQSGKKLETVKPIPATIGEHHLLYDSQIGRNFNQSSFAPKNCKICYKEYSCNSSLNLHLKKKHKAFRLEDGRLVFQALPNIDGDFKCQICGLTYDLQGILVLHKQYKHSKNPPDSIPHAQSEVLKQEMQKCGCGLVYQSRSALHLHVKKKHNGIYPQGTTNLSKMRKKPNFQYYTLGSQQEQDSNKPDIYYDSDSQQNDKPIKPIQEPQKKQPPLLQQRIFKCGCGRPYSCNSALNLHIRRHHNSIVPKGTIGGPQGNRQNPHEYAKRESIKKEGGIVFECGQCSQNVSKVSRFVCKSCNHHYMCSNCFWGKDNFNEQHQWVVDQPSRK